MAPPRSKWVHGILGGTEESVPETATTFDFAMLGLTILLLGAANIVFISLDLAEYDASNVHVVHELVANVTAPDNLAPLRYFTWIGFLVGAFLAFRIVVALDWIKDKGMGLSFGLDALFRLVYDGSFLYVAAAIKDKIFYPEHLPQGVFLALILGFIIVYTVAFEVWRDRDIKVTYDRITKSPLTAFAVAVCAGIVILVFVNLLLTAWRVGVFFFTVYATILFFVIGAHVVAWLVCNAHGTAYIHLHHYYIAILCAHACIFGSNSSMVIQSGFVAVYIHGIAVFGPETIFGDTSASQHLPIKR